MVSSFGGHDKSTNQPFTDLGYVFQAMSIQPPPENNYYMDSRASSHMSFNSGNMFSLAPCTSKSIMVGNGVVLTVSHIGHTYLSHSHNRLTLKNVLVSNRTVKNLLLIHKFLLTIMFILHLIVSFYYEGK